MFSGYVFIQFLQSYYIFIRCPFSLHDKMKTTGCIKFTSDTNPKWRVIYKNWSQCI